MVINDLKKICPQCRGSGRQAGRAQWGITQINPSGRCNGCAGRGFVLTELGQELVAMLRPFVQELIDADRQSGTAHAVPRPATETEPAGEPKP